MKFGKKNLMEVRYYFDDVLSRGKIKVIKVGIIKINVLKGEIKNLYQYEPNIEELK